MKKLNKYQTGLSLIELMVAGLIGVILMYGAINMLMSNQRVYRDQNEIGLLQENVTLTEEYLDTIEARLVVLNSKTSNFRDTINNSVERVRAFLSEFPVYE